MEAFARLLGTPQLGCAHGSYDPPPSKATTLLLYLAYRGEWCSRDELLYLFYPDTGEVAARSSLRQLLTSLRRLPYSGGLETEPTRLRWRVATDVQAFRQAASERRWPRAAELYRGELLQGWTLAGAPEFGSWLECEREALRGTWREATLGCAGQLEEAGRFAEAAALLEKLYRADPLDEAVLQRYAAAVYRSGERSRALSLCEAFARTLLNELGGGPDAATLALAGHIREGEPLAPAAALPAVSGGRPGAATPRNTLPLPATPFVGRQAEKAGLLERLGDPACRLLTVVGVGGAGKTRLAAEVAAAAGDAFADGTCFVPFAPVASPELLVSTVADALAFAFFGPDEPKRQLLTYLRDKQMLFVLDNLEHLLGDLSFLVALLETAPGVKLLATSREPLDLHAEWLFDLGGLSCPPRAAARPADPPGSADEQSLEDYDAVRLFIQSARKARADFRQGDGVVPAVAHICRLVEGLPLALELAAGWLRLLPPGAVAAELERGLDLLEAATRDLPVRHRSLRAVFGSSWDLLTAGERGALRRLSVFHGGFTREAAAAVADASLPLLSGLVNKSLLKTGGAGRFEWHPLVRQYSRERADADPGERDGTRDRHCAYYASLLHSLEGAIHGGEGQREAFSAIDRELADVRAAWNWAAERRDVNALALMLESLQQFYYVQGRLREGEEAFTVATERLDEDSVTLSRLLVAQSLFAWEQRRLDTAQVACERSIAIRKRLGAPPDARAYLHLGIAHVIKEDFGKAELLHHEGLAVARAGGDLYGVGCNLNMLAQVAAEKGEVEKAERYYHESVATFRERRDRWGVTLAIGNLGLLLANAGRHKEAEACYREGLEHARELGNLQGTAFTLSTLGELNVKQKNYRRAQTLYLESLSIWRGMDSPCTHFALSGLGTVAHASGDPPAALRYFAEAARSAARFGDRQDAVAITVDVADTLLSLGDDEEAFALLTFALQHEGFEREAAEKAARLTGELSVRLPPDAVAAAERRGRGLTLEDVLATLAAVPQPEPRGGVPTS